jgi:hypothetical protein
MGAAGEKYDVRSLMEKVLGRSGVLLCGFQGGGEDGGEFVRFGVQRFDFGFSEQPSVHVIDAGHPSGRHVWTAVEE